MANLHFDLTIFLPSSASEEIPGGIFCLPMDDVLLIWGQPEFNTRVQNIPPLGFQQTQQKTSGKPNFWPWATPSLA